MKIHDLSICFIPAGLLPCFFAALSRILPVSQAEKHASAARDAYLLYTGDLQDPEYPKTLKKFKNYKKLQTVITCNIFRRKTFALLQIFLYFQTKSW